MKSLFSLGQPPPSTPCAPLDATKQFLILYPSTLLILSVSPCMKRFVLDCRFDGDTHSIVAKVIPPIIASNMLAEAGETAFVGLALFDIDRLSTSSFQ